MEYKKPKQAEQALNKLDRDGREMYPTSIERIRKTEYPLLKSTYFSPIP